jgi:hypothetical protein
MLLYVLAAIFIMAALTKGIYVEQIATSFLVLFILFALFYKEDEPPVIIFALGMQWLSIAIGHFYLVFFNASQSELLWRPLYSLAKIDSAYWLSMLALLAFSLGLKIAIRHVKLNFSDSHLIQQYDISKIILIYILFSLVFEPLANLLRFILPGIYQALKAITFFKWSLFFLMVYISFKKNEKKKLVLSLIMLEILLAFTGYFAEFASFMILLPIVYLSFNKIHGTKQITTILLAAFLMINIGAIWSYVKVEYRPYLSGGAKAQVVTVSKQEALNKLWVLSTNISSEQYSLGFEALIKRIYFLEYFSATVNHIPYFRPYLGGGIWGKSFQHIFMPRLFFPAKQAIDDSKQTFLLTGIDVADASEGVSISTGYMAESYADFGPVEMHLAIFLLGFMLGLIYKNLLNDSLNEFWGFAIIFPMYFLLNINGKSLIKIFGDTAYFFMVFYLLKRYGVPYIDQLMKRKAESIKHKEEIDLRI